MALAAKKLTAKAGNIRVMGSIPESGRSPGGRLGNLLQYSCLENPHGWRSLVAHGVAELGMTE